jgi:serine/threonine protein kinase
VTNFVGFKDVWEEDRMNIKLGPMIGSGNFGEVYKGLWRDRFVVAVKTLKFTDQEKRNVKKEEARKEEFRKELEIMKKLRHEKLVKLWCVCTIGEPVYIVTEYMCNGSLLKYMREGEGANLAFKEIIDMAAQIACGMKYLEGSRCVHRDLAARNILVGERNIVKIADFGFAQMLNANDRLELSQDESNKFPVKWTAPEVFSVDPNTGLRAYTIKSDVWSFGILLYELITLGANPYPGMTHPQVIYEVKENHYRMPKPPGICTDAYYAIMLKCWHENPQERPTFDSLYHFFNDYFINTQPCYRNPGEP